MNELEAIRQHVWGELRRVARPDSRFHWDFTAFIPDFDDSAACAASIRDLPQYRQAAAVCVTPDNCLAEVRAGCLADGKTLWVPTYALGRGFWQLAPGSVPAGQEAYAATLDGLERFAKPCLVETAEPAAGPALLVTGASVINTQGVRISRDPSYFDLEWLILRALDLVHPDATIIAAVHDCQVVEWDCEPQPFSAIADLIVTPTRVITAAPPLPKPDRIDWADLAWEVIRDVPLLLALYERDPSRTGTPSRPGPAARGE